MIKCFSSTSDIKYKDVENYYNDLQDNCCYFCPAQTPAGDMLWDSNGKKQCT